MRLFNVRRCKESRAGTARPGVEGGYGRRLAVEGLEDRRMLAAEVGWLDWVEQFGTPLSDTATGGITADNSSLYVAGQTQQDVSVTKFDMSGNLIWAKQFGTVGFDRAFDVSSDGSSIYIAGDTGNAVLGDGDADAFVAKLDNTGNVLWTKQFGSIDDDAALGISADSNGVYIGGWTRGTLPGETSSGGAGGDAFIMRMDSSGNVLWTEQFGTPGSDSLGIGGVEADSTGVYVSGRTTGAFPGQTDAGQQDTFVRKFDTGGNALWTTQFGTSLSEWAGGLAIDSTGVYFSGWTNGAFVGESNSGGDDAFVTKLDHSGDLLWNRQFGTAEIDNATDVVADSSGIYVTGITDGVFVGASAAGDRDSFVTKLNISGDILWTEQFGTSGFEWSEGITANSAGIYITGHTNGVFPGQTSAGATDRYAARFESRAVKDVEIDVKPGSDSNSTNVAGNGLISVAIFTTTEFDATQIDATSVIFADATAVQFALEDVDGDGDLDMILHFEIQDTALAAIYQELLEDDIDGDGVLDSSEQEAEVSLFGETLDDQLFEGSDQLSLLLRGRALRELLDEIYA